MGSTEDLAGPFAGMFDLPTFTSRVTRDRDADPACINRAGTTLVGAALRMRRGGDGLYGDPPARPVTKPADALSAWFASLAGDMGSEKAFHRQAELREALVAAAEEVDAAATATGAPSALRLRNALYSDAIDAIIGNDSPPVAPHSATSVVPWVVAAGLGGLTIGLLIALFTRHK